MSAVSASSSTVVADAAGNASAVIGPVPVGQSWRVTSTQVESSSSARSTATLYRNTPVAGNKIDQSRRGGNADATDTIYRVRAGESVVCVWSGCDVGARCTFRVEGDTE